MWMYQDSFGNTQNPMTMNPAYPQISNYQNRYLNRMMSNTQQMPPVQNQSRQGNPEPLIFVAKTSDIENVPVSPNQSIWIMATNDAVLARKTADGIGIPSVEYCRLERLNNAPTGDSDNGDSLYLTKKEFYDWVNGQGKPVAGSPVIKRKKEETPGE